jgi:hypothetical protein
MYRLRQVIAVFGLATLLACSLGHAEPALHDGDIIFQTSRSRQSVAIQRATGSPYSHMGMIVHRGGKPFVLEAAGQVRYTALAEWTQRGVGGHYTVKRLRGAAEALPAPARKRAEHAINTLLGKAYDLTFEWSDQRMYCSELVWKIYERALGVRLGELTRLGDFKLDDPAVKHKLRERYGTEVPLEEPVISPVAMFESPLLETVLAR